MYKDQRAVWICLLVIGFVSISTTVMGASTDQSKAINSVWRFPGQKLPYAPVAFTFPGLPPNGSELKISLSMDGKEALIGVRLKTVPTVLRSTFGKAGWSKPEPAVAIVANLREKEPFFSPDGQKLFFVRYASIFVSNRSGHSWSAPEQLGWPINDSTAEQYHPTSTLDGTLYFCSNRGGVYNIYRSKCENGRYLSIEKLGPAINLHENGADGAYDPYVAPDESYLIFSSNRPGGNGKEDQYISFNIGGHWTGPKNLGPGVNTAGTEYGSYVSPDKKYYFFARWDDSGNAQLYWVGADFIDSLRRANSAPVVKYGTPNLGAKTGRFFKFAVPDSAFTDDDGNSDLVYSAVLSNGDSLPSWLKFDSDTRTFSGKPTQEGTFSVRLSATDSYGEVASTDFSLVISKPADLVTGVVGRTIRPRHKGGYLGETPPGETPVPFAPEVLDSISGWIEATDFSPDGNFFFFSVGTADYSEAKLFYSKRVNGKWSPIAEPPFCQDFIYSNEPSFSADGTSLTFSGKKEGGSIDQWTVSYAKGAWGSPVDLPSPINSDKKDHRGSKTTDGTYYFCSNRSGMMQIYCLKEDSSNSMVAEMLPSPVNVKAYDGDPCIAPDGHFLLFFSARDGRSADFYVSFRDSAGHWVEPVNLGDSFNSPVDEYGAHFTCDGKYLFFTRHSLKGNEIFWVAVSAIEKFKK